MNHSKSQTSQYKNRKASLAKTYEFEVADQVQDSLMFIVEKKESTYHFITCQGALLQKFGYEDDAFNGKQIDECLPKYHAIRRAISYDRAWEGNSVTYEDTLNGIPYMGAVSPVYDEKGEVTRLQGFCVDMSKKKRAEEKLKEREYYFRTLFNYHPDGIFTLNKDGRFLFINPAVSQICGYDEHELYQTHFMPLIVPEERQKAEDFFHRAKQGEMLHFETSVFHKDGHQIDLQVTNIPINIDGEIHSIYGIVKDISCRKKSEKELHHLRHRIASMIYQSADSIAVFDLKNHLISANPAFEAFYGWTEEELIGKTVPYIPEEELKTYLHIINKVKKGEKFTGLESTRIRKDGTKFYVSVTFSPLHDEDGDIIGYSAITRDIHSQKIAQEALRKKNEQYQIITEHTMDLISVFNADGQIMYSSPSHYAVLGYESGSFTDLEWTEIVHPEDLPDLLKSIANLKNSKQSMKMEVRVKNSEGQWLTLETYGTAVVNHKEEVDSIVTISRDITERKKTEDFLRKSEKLAVLGQLAAGIAHEIRNPLTSLKGFTHLLRANASEEEHDYYQIMLSELERINTIVGEFMMLAKPQPKNVKKNDIGRVLKEAASLLEAQANLHSIEFILDLDSELFLECEADQLKQVFINLMKNGIEAMEDDGKLLKIKAKKEQDAIVISFKDDGCGIPQDKIDHIGEPFYTTKEKGTGLGMMICNKIIENHNGKLEIESEVDKGTVVTLTFPKA
ncbi:PAS domain S-box protein [Pseudalkalibacillus sp. SCS-8]|uniref:PAS domain S-box protein n=1 Tax=Pseudalkalibacillus nanhaiensis TaxID=3115291 RepID=UPI0032DA2071